MKNFSRVVCKNKKLIVFISLVLLFFSFIGMKLTKVNYDILVYLPKDIETVKGEEILTNDFNMGAYSIAIVNGLKGNEIIAIQNRISNIEGVNKVVSLYDVLGSSIPVDMIPSEISDRLHKNDSDILFITYSDSTSSESTINAVKEIRNITPDNFNVSGMSNVVYDTMNLSDKEIVAYILIAVLLCIVVLTFTLDSYVVPYVLLLNIGFAIMLNLGTNIFLGEISYITKALVAVLQLGVTTDFSIFLYHSYESKKYKYKTKEDAMVESISDTFASVTGSSLTTIAGFLVLCAMSLTLGKDLGIVMAKGVLLGLISVLVLFPSLLLLFDNIIEKTKHKIFIPKFDKINKFIIKNNKIFLILFILLLIPFYLGCRKVDVYYKIDRALPQSLRSISTNRRLKEEFGLSSTEIILLDKSIMNDKASKLVDELRDVEGMQFVLSFSKIKEFGITEEMVSKYKDLVSNDKYDLIILNSIYENATDELNNQIDIVNKIVKKYDSNAIVAGEGPLTKDLIQTSKVDFVNVNYASVICIFIILFFVLRSFSLPFLLIVAIEFAIFANMSISYFNGTILPFIAPIVLGTIQLGATIDYAILMTTNYLENRKKLDKNDAMLKTLNYTGESIFTSGMCFFAATFGVGLYSKLDMVGTLCSLISRGAIISMIVVITVLPSILLIFDRLINKTVIKKGDKMKRIKKLAIWLLLLVSTISMPVNALTKNETVYQKLNYDGTKKSTTITEQIINNEGLDRIEDYTILSDILNLNTSTFDKKDNNLVWNTNKGNVLYSGKTDKELPIIVNVTYKLDGKEMNIDDMIGKSGKVEITMKFKNNECHYIPINGKYEYLCTPFVIATGTIISDEYNNNFNISNGRIINNGFKNIIVGINSPGLYESLGLEDLKDFDTLTLTYQTTKFELSSIYMMATSKILDTTDLKIFNKLDNLYYGIDKLQTNMDKIENGAKTLSEGTNTLYTNYNQFNNGISTLNDNVKTLNTGVSELYTGINTILSNEKVTRIRNYMPTLSNNAREVADFVNKYQDNANNFLDSTNNVVDKIADKLINMLEYLQNVDDYKEESGKYKDLIKEYINSISEYINLLDNYKEDLENTSNFVKSAATYIINEYNNNPIEASDELKELYAKALELKNNENLIEALDKLKNVLNEINDKLYENKDNIEAAYNDMVNKLKEIKDEVTDLEKDKERIDNLRNNIKSNKERFNNAVQKLNNLPNQIDNISNKINEFEEGINKLKDGTDKLVTGVETLKIYSNDIYDGIDKINDGALTLYNGIKTYNKEGINGISSYANTIKTVSLKLREIGKLSNKYESFAGKTNMAGDTKFILVIDAKKAPKKNTEIKKETKKLSFWDRLVNLFK